VEVSRSTEIAIGARLAADLGLTLLRRQLDTSSEAAASLLRTMFENRSLDPSIGNHLDARG